MKDDRVYLAHILECVRKIERAVGGSKTKYLGSELVQDAILRNLQILSESTQRLSDELKERHPAVEWRRIADFRNRLVHDYLGVDLEIVWHVIKADLPALKAAIEEMIGPPSLKRTPGDAQARADLPRSRRRRRQQKPRRPDPGHRA